MSDNSNTDKKYSGLLNYIFSDHLTSFSITIIVSIIIFFIFIIISTTSENNKGLFIFCGFILFTLISGFYIVYEYSDYNKYKDDYTARQKKIQDDADAKEKAENEALLEENAICNVNPNLCMNGGSCQSFGEDKQQFRCHCTAGWTGNNCNTPDNITISDSDIDPRCSDKTTGEKKPNLEWCNANFDGKGGKCVDKLEYQIQCPINHDGSPNYKYNENGCDVDNDEVWCPETSADRIGKCVIRSADEVGEPCNVRIIGQDCLGNPDLIWDNGKQTCVPDCGRGKVYNKNLQKCVTYNCSQHSASSTCSGEGIINYCKWNNTEKKCLINRSNTQCQSLGKNRCQNSERCTWSNNMCYNNDNNDCEYITNKNHCQKHPQCSWNSASNICQKCSEDCIKGDRIGRDRRDRNNNEGFKVGGRIKNTFVVSSDGFVVSGYSDI